MSALLHIYLLLLLVLSIRGLVGTRRVGGSRRRFASIGMSRPIGGRTPATGITAECSSRSTPGDQSVGEGCLVVLHPANNYSVRIGSTDATEVVGVSGELPHDAA